MRYSVGFHLAQAGETGTPAKRNFFSTRSGASHQASATFWEEGYWFAMVAPLGSRWNRGQGVGAVAFLRPCPWNRIAPSLLSVEASPGEPVMSDAPADADGPREELRQRFLGHCAAAFDLMFRPEYQDQLITFDQREERAFELGRDLTCWLLQQHANADAQACPDGQLPPACPKCGRPGRRLTEPDQPLPKRPITTRAGEVTLSRQRWRCTTCRVVFFPPGPEVATGDGGLQPRRAPPDRAPGR